MGQQLPFLSFVDQIVECWARRNLSELAGQVGNMAQCHWDITLVNSCAPQPPPTPPPKSPGRVEDIGHDSLIVELGAALEAAASAAGGGYGGGGGKTI